MKYIFIIVCLVITSCGVSSKKMLPPDVSAYNVQMPKVVRLSDSLSYYDENYLLRNKYGIWEAYLSGNPYQLGLNSGALTQKLYHRQDSIFFEKLKTFVPSAKKQRFIHKFLKWFNRDINENIIEPYRVELFGQSKYADTVYNYVAPAYERSLYLHSAHDIGHALQDLMLVGCSSVAVWGKNSADGKLLIGRNFDFYLSDDFATEKLIRFVRPSEGIPFVSYSWGGMIGVLSGMNLAGLTVTINAGKSTIPLKARTPISLLCREILQYASTIEEAVAIARSHKVFVSEAIMIGSAKDGKAILIEISPKKIDLYEVSNSTSLICANHFQSKAFQKDKRNQKHIAESHSAYRFEKIQELLSSNEALTPLKMATLLRTTEGLNGNNIGYGNEKSLNQLLAHHAIIFQPEDKLVYTSTHPYQLGEFIAFDLKEIFSNDTKKLYHSHVVDSLVLPKSDFLSTKDYSDYEKYRLLERKIESNLQQKLATSTEDLTSVIALNPNYWKGYYIVGKSYYQQGDYTEALKYFEIALSKEIPYTKIKKTIQDYARKSKKKQNQ
ncbi:MAG: C45 family autoproteolytic acyltransferase/hydrolase [Capnocytophaga sp.]|nr:C45 family autoproteolytic acyltransferase/hydrolase [Capnocytophaga sp.]